MLHGRAGRHVWARRISRLSQNRLLGARTGARCGQRLRTVRAECLRQVERLADRRRRCRQILQDFRKTLPIPPFTAQASKPNRNLESCALNCGAVCFVTGCSCLTYVIHEEICYPVCLLPKKSPRIYVADHNDFTDGVIYEN